MTEERNPMTATESHDGDKDLKKPEAAEEAPAFVSASDRKIQRFWVRKSTTAAREELTIWASVYQARKLGLDTIPTKDAIFDVPPGYLPKFQLTENGPWQIDWEMFRNDQNRGVRSPEEAVYLGVMLILKRAKMLDLIPRLLRWFPECGLYHPGRTIAPGVMPYVDQQIIWAVLREVVASQAKRLTPEEKAARLAQKQAARRQRMAVEDLTVPEYNRATRRDHDGARDFGKDLTVGGAMTKAMKRGSKK